MKKLLTISLILFVFIVFSGCMPSYVMGASSTEENKSFNHYNFGAFKGTYTFKKSFSEDTRVRIVTYTETEDDVLYIRITKDNDVLHTIEVTKFTNNTYYFDLEKGNYKFEIESANVFKGELLFDWKNEE